MKVKYMIITLLIFYYFCQKYEQKLEHVHSRLNLDKINNVTHHVKIDSPLLCTSSEETHYLFAIGIKQHSFLEEERKVKQCVYQVLH